MGIFSLIIWLIVIAFVFYILRKFFNGPRTPFTKSMIGKIVIVTGSNTGIGKETALDLLDKGAKVIFACRSEERTLQVINSIQDPVQKENAIFMKVDLSSFESINKFVKQFETSFGKFDVLVNNAGGIFDTFELKEGIESTIMINHIGPAYLTILLLPLLNYQGLIVNVSSMMHTFINQMKFDEYMNVKDFSNQGPASSVVNNYSFTKLCNVLFALHLDKYAVTHNLNFKTASLHPGAVSTEFQQRSTTLLWKIVSWLMWPFQIIFFKDAKMGAQTTLHVIYSDYMQLNSGAYFNNCAEEKKNPLADKPENVTQLMIFTRDLIYKNLSNIPKEVKGFFTS